MRTPESLDLSSAHDTPTIMRRVVEWSRAVVEALRARPAIATIAVAIDPALLPVYVPCAITSPSAVLRCRTQRASDSVLIADTGLVWRPSDDPTRPGLKIEQLPSTSSGTTYAITLLVIGEVGRA